ncbi:hypothetical protein KCU81_g741, partial [Aureobasidium melanogenum]
MNGDTYLHMVLFCDRINLLIVFDFLVLLSLFMTCLLALVLWDIKQRNGRFAFCILDEFFVAECTNSLFYLVKAVIAALTQTGHGSPVLIGLVFVFIVGLMALDGLDVEAQVFDTVSEVRLHLYFPPSLGREFWFLGSSGSWWRAAVFFFIVVIFSITTLSFVAVFLLPSLAGDTGLGGALPSLSTFLTCLGGIVERLLVMDRDIVSMSMSLCARPLKARSLVLVDLSYGVLLFALHRFATRSNIGEASECDSLRTHGKDDSYAFKRTRCAKRQKYPPAIVIQRGRTPVGDAEAEICKWLSTRVPRQTTKQRTKETIATVAVIVILVGVLVMPLIPLELIGTGICDGAKQDVANTRRALVSYCCAIKASLPTFLCWTSTFISLSIPFSVNIPFDLPSNNIRT